MKLLVVLAALLLAGCSVEVAHETENKAQTESLSTFDKNKTTVAVGILQARETSPESRDTDSHESVTSQTTVKVIVAERSSEVVTPTPPVVRRPDRMTQVTGRGNTIVLGDILHHHEHFHIHEKPKPTPVRINVRVEMDSTINERERRRRMAEKRISKFFPRYRK